MLVEHDLSDCVSNVATLDFVLLVVVVVGGHAESI